MVVATSLAAACPPGAGAEPNGHVGNQVYWRAGAPRAKRRECVAESGRQSTGGRAMAGKVAVTVVS